MAILILTRAAAARDGASRLRIFLHNKVQGLMSRRVVLQPGRYPNGMLSQRSNSWASNLLFLDFEKLMADSVGSV